MRSIESFSLLVAAALAVALTVNARAEEKDKKSQLDVLKSLAGEWTGKAKHGDAEHDATVTYRVTAGGSAVEETEFPGTEHEMVTLYHMDGDDLVLTHYCMLHNQPRMKAERGGGGKKLTFKFVSAGNLKSDKEAHMHDMTLDVIDDNHIKATWTMYADGKATGTTSIDLTRKKK
jgi:hypothetical protein